MSEPLIINSRDDVTVIRFGRRWFNSEGGSGGVNGDGQRGGAFKNPLIRRVNEVLREAAHKGRAVLVSSDEIQLPDDTISVLAEFLERDPYFGFAFPRLLSEDGEVHSLPLDPPDSRPGTFPRRVLSYLPSYYIALDFMAPCFLIRDTVVSNFGFLNDSCLTLSGAFAHYICLARRVGFRTIIVNRTAAYGGFPPSSGQVYIPAADLELLFKPHPEESAVRGRVLEEPFFLEEKLLSCACSREPSLLIDLTGVREFHNGTSEAGLALVDAMYQLIPDRKVSIMCSELTRDYHNVAERYPAWDIVGPGCSNHYAVLFRVNQPWSVSSLYSLHKLAFFNIVSILDTICWDIQYRSPESLGEAWRVCAKYIDGIVYDSSFSAERFRTRFPLAPAVKEHVQHYSLHPDEYRLTGESSGGEGEYILVVGNELEHKMLRWSISFLSEAFPFEKIKVLGLESAEQPQVEAIAAGKLPFEEIHLLYAGAKAVIYPSFYEGFGFPVVRALARGKTVIARRLALYQEIAAHYRGAGRLCLFASPAELFELVGKCLHGEELPVLTLGRALKPDEEPLRWKDAAKNVLSFIEKVSSDVNPSRWRERDCVLRAKMFGK